MEVALQKLMQQTFSAVAVWLALCTSPTQAENLPRSLGMAGKPPAAPAIGANWSHVATFPGRQATQPVLLMDGGVIIQDFCSRDWYKLTPDRFGDYSKGSWSKIAQLPKGYAPYAYSSQVLPDGRVIIAGGEYTRQEGGTCNAVMMSGEGAVYDPSKNTWAHISPLKDFEIGDAPSIVLSDGTFIVGGQDSNAAPVFAKFDPKKTTWKELSPKIAANYSNSEAGWTLLPNDKVFSLSMYCADKLSKAFVYDPDKIEWMFASDTPERLVLCDVKDTESGESEIGTNLVLPNGKVLLLGAAPNPDDNKTLGAATALYDPAQNKFTKGPRLPAGYASADAPAALLPNGSVLFAAIPAFTKPPTRFYLYVVDGNSYSITQIGEDSTTTTSSFSFLILPSGQVLTTNGNLRDIYFYTPSKLAQKPSWAPRITSAFPSSGLAREQEYAVTGERLNGVSEGGAFNDESQTSTNYPIFRLKEKFSGKVYYCRTTGLESRSIAQNAVTTARFVVPKIVPAGASYSYVLEVVANGVASSPVNVVIR